MATVRGYSQLVEGQVSPRYVARFTKQRAGVFSFQQQSPPGIKPPQHCASPEIRDYSNPIVVNRAAAIECTVFLSSLLFFRISPGQERKRPQSFPHGPVRAHIAIAATH
ncbi:hypothetical protein, partial [Kluyvera ascorbata]|uniref:hypothetical protein n=1 Tax=Kluyvera ascorbata TaxID=51288 RepID=UPI0022E51064